MKTIHAYTDGASSGNPGPSASACLLVGDRLFVQPLYVATNNVAELWAIYMALARVEDNAVVIIHTDSQFSIGMLTKGWRTQHNEIARCVSCIKKEIALGNLVVSFQHVRGHSSNRYNNIVDQAAWTFSQREKNAQAAGRSIAGQTRSFPAPSS